MKLATWWKIAVWCAVIYGVLFVITAPQEVGHLLRQVVGIGVKSAWAAAWAAFTGK